MNSRFLIYALCDPHDGQIRYVGLSSQGLDRPRFHWTRKNLRERKDHCHSWVRSILSLGLLPTIEVLEEFESSDFLNEAEQFWIAYLRFVGFRLTNMTDGGGGIFGYRHPPEILKIIGQKNKGKIPWQKGKPAWNRGLTKETNESVASQAEKMKKIAPGRIPWNKGKTKADLSGIARQAEKMKGDGNPFHSSKGRKIYGGRRWKVNDGD